MTVLDRLPLEFWEESQNIYRKYKKGSISLAECFERQRQCLPRNKTVKKDNGDEKKKKMEDTKKNDDDKKSQKKTRADAIFEKIRARSEKAKKEEENPVVKEEKVEPKEAEDEKVVEEVTKSSAPYNCEECAKEGKDYSGSVQSLFEGHIKMKHPNYQPFKCEKCEFKSNRKANVNRHVIKHHKN